MDKFQAIINCRPGRGLLTLDRKGNLRDTTLSLNFGEPLSQRRLVVIIYPTQRGAWPLPLAEVKTIRLASREGGRTARKSPLFAIHSRSSQISEYVTHSPCQGVWTVLFLYLNHHLMEETESLQSSPFPSLLKRERKFNKRLTGS